MELKLKVTSSGNCTWDPRTLAPFMLHSHVLASVFLMELTGQVLIEGYLTSLLFVHLLIFELRLIFEINSKSLCLTNNVKQCELAQSKMCNTKGPIRYPCETNLYK